MRTGLQVMGLRKSFGKKEVVKGVDLHIHSGEIVSLLGPNGAGKTTTFYMIVGFLKASAGTILLNGRDVTHLPMYKRTLAGVSYLAQEASVFQRLTVEKNVWAVLETRFDLSKKDKLMLLDRLIEELGIEHVRKQPAHTLSGGERRRTEIARALALEPHLLLLDEPFAGIDPIAISEIKSIIRELCRQDIGILITDHNAQDTLSITDRAYIINLGEILVEGPRDEIVQNEVALEHYLGSEFTLTNSPGGKLHKTHSAKQRIGHYGIKKRILNTRFSHKKSR